MAQTEKVQTCLFNRNIEGLLVTVTKFKKHNINVETQVQENV